MALTLAATDLLTWDEHVDRMHRSGFRWNRSDYPVISLDTANLLLGLVEETVATAGVCGDTLTDCIQARDELQAAICHAQDVS
jgi:hypothetical protein